MLISKCLFFFDVINSLLHENLWESREVLQVVSILENKHTPPPQITFQISTYWLMT